MFKTILKTAVLSAITITFLSACGAATRALNGAANNAVNLALQDAEKRYLGNIEEIIDENGNTIQVTLDENGKRIQVSTDDNGNPILIASTAPPTPNNEVLYVHVHGKNHPASWQVNYDDKAGISCVERNSFCSVNGFDSRIPEYQFFTWDTAKATYAGNVKASIDGIHYANDVEFLVDFSNQTIESGATQLGDHTLTLNGVLTAPERVVVNNTYVPAPSNSLYVLFDGTAVIDGYAEGLIKGAIGETRMIGGFENYISSGESGNGYFVGAFQANRQ